MAYTDEEGKVVQEQYDLITPAEGRVALMYSDTNGGELDAAVQRVIDERVAPYNTEEYKAMKLGYHEGPGQSIGSEPSIGSEHSVAGIDPANDPDVGGLVTDLGTIGQYETGPDGDVVIDDEVVPEEEVPEAEAEATSKKGGRR